MISDVVVTTRDGTSLSARAFAPEGKAIGAAFIVGAMGVPQKFYQPLASWLAGQGLHAITFDYRGMGLSRRGSLKDLRADIFTWSEEDTAAVFDALAARAGDLPLTWIGHSLGGQIIPLVPNSERAAKIITIATGSGYWRENAPQLRNKVALLWWGMVPVLTPLFGYFPGERFNLVGDLPRGVITQWRKWCLNREYSVGAEGESVRKSYARVKTPITSLSFTDDEMMSEKNINSIHSFYTGSAKSMLRFSPDQLGLKRIGHFGFFRAEMEAPLWNKLLAPELARANAG